MLHVENLSYQLPQKRLLHQVNLQVAPGSFTAILGANGAGKSTLLKVLSGDIGEYSGHVRYNGKALSAFSWKDLALIRAVLPQSVEVSFPYSVLEIVELGAIPLNRRPIESRQMALQSLDRLGLLALAHRSYQTLSGGEKQRVQLARVITQITHSPELNKYVLLDEPTASLDIACQHQILEEAKKLTCQNIGIIAILHDLNQAGYYADQVLMLKQGQSVALGPTAQIFNKKNIQETYGHPVYMHSIDGSVPYVIPHLGPISQLNYHQSLQKI